MKQQDFSDTKYQSFIEQYLFADLDNKSFQGFEMEDVHFDDTSGKSTESSVLELNGRPLVQNE